MCLEQGFESRSPIKLSLFFRLIVLWDSSPTPYQESCWNLHRTGVVKLSKLCGLQSDPFRQRSLNCESFPFQTRSKRNVRFILRTFRLASSKGIHHDLPRNKIHPGLSDSDLHSNQMIGQKLRILKSGLHHSSLNWASLQRFRTKSSSNSSSKSNLSLISRALECSLLASTQAHPGGNYRDQIKDTLEAIHRAVSMDPHYTISRN